MYYMCINKNLVHQVGDQTKLLIQYIRSYPPYWRPFLDPQPEDASWHGDRGPIMMVLPSTFNIS
jgi:hypothetical protein